MKEPLSFGVVKCGCHRVEGSCCWSCLGDADKSNSSAQFVAAAWRAAARQLAWSAQQHGDMQVNYKAHGPKCI